MCRPSSISLLKNCRDSDQQYLAAAIQTRTGRPETLRVTIADVCESPIELDLGAMFLIAFRAIGDDDFQLVPQRVLRSFSERSPDGAERNPGWHRRFTAVPDFAPLHPGYAAGRRTRAIYDGLFPLALKIKIRSPHRRYCHSTTFCISPDAPKCAI